MMKKLTAFLKKQKEILSYLFWGVMTTLVSWGSYSVFMLILPPGEQAIVAANALSWSCSVLFAFITNKLWVFGSRIWSLPVVLPELQKFIAARLGTGLLELIGVPLLAGAGLNQSWLGIEGMSAKVVVSVVVVLGNYVLSKRLIFKSRTKGR